MLVVGVSASVWGLARSPAQAADLVDVTVRITRIFEVEDQDGDGSDGDFYTQVDIDGQGFQQSSRIEDDDFGESAMDPSWRFTRTVDRESTGPVDITIRLKDYDDGLAGGDDFADISPRNDDVELNLRYNPFSGRWDVAESDVPGTVAEGDGDHGFPEDNDGRIARIEFQVFTGGNADQDGDGIPDAVELAGVRRTDGSFAADLAFLGANPCQKTILIEVDWMQGSADGHNHRPKGPALDEIRTAFRNAPIPAPGACPYQGFSATAGVQLIITVSSPIPEAAVFTLNDLDATRNNPANFDPLRRPYFHYVVFAHDQAAGSSSSGLCCRQGKDFIVTLGSWNLGNVCVTPGPDGVLNTTAQGDDQSAGGQITYGGNGVCETRARNLAAPPPAVNDDAQALAVGIGLPDAQVGTVRDQSGTMMHELGHALGLGHRGRDDINHAPNYLSNMSYFFQQGIPLAGAAGSVLDWSGAVLPTLTEATLSESAILDATSPYNTFWYDATGALWTGRAAQPIDWDQIPGPAGIVNVDVNLDSGCVSFGADGTRNSTPGGDDLVSRGVIVNGPNDRCETTTTGDDMPILTGAGGTPLNQTCVGVGANEKRDSTAAGDDATFTNAINSGPNLVCDTTAGGDDIQVVPVGRSEPPSHPGWNDWANIKFRAVDSPNASGAGAGHVGDQTFEDVLQMQVRTVELLSPDLAAAKSVDRSVASAGDRLTYTTTAHNVGTGEATEVTFRDTLPNGAQQTKSGSNVFAGRSTSVGFTYDVPCGLADGTVLVNSVTIGGKNLQAQPESNASNNTATASTTVRAPVLTLDKTATATVGSGEAITYELTYANVGSGAATGVLITDTVPADVYYSLALDLGSGPAPTSVVVNADGTRTLTWAIGAVAGNSGQHTIRFTARPTLLSLGGSAYENRARLMFTDANGCTYPPVFDSASTGIVTVTPTQNPGTLGYWGQHPETWTAELRARVQATDQRYDTDGSGDLSDAEMTAMFAAGGNQPKILQMQLLATYLNLGSRRVDAGTQLTSRTARRLVLINVRDGALYAVQTLKVPPSSTNRDRFSDATTVLDDINNGRQLRY